MSEIYVSENGNIKVVREEMQKVYELEKESHRLLDDSFMNVAFANLSEGSRKEKITQTYEAIGKHAEAMDILRKLLEY